MYLILKRDPVWLDSLPLSCVNEALAILIGDNGCQVPVSAAILLAASPLVRSIFSDLPPAFCPIVLSVPTASRDVLEAVVEIMSKGSRSAMLNSAKIENIKEMLRALQVDSVISTDFIMAGVKDENTTVNREVDVEIKNECAIKIEIEIKKETDIKEMDMSKNLLECDQIPDLPMEPAIENNVKRVEKRKDKIHECDLCKFKARYDSELIAHKRMHTGERLFECNECEYKARRQTNLTIHKRVHTGERPFECDKCEYKARDRSVLHKHMMRLHAYKRPFECDQCEYKAKENKNLITHKKIHHTGESYFRFKCEQCDYKAKVQSLLIVHQRIHTDERPFGCDQCDYKAREKSKLNVHKRIHIQEKPFHCDQCDYKAREKRKLVVHKRIHSQERPFECDQCDYKGRDKTNLTRHKRNHSQERTFECNLCEGKRKAYQT